MPVNPDDPLPMSWHRHFAIAANNAAWPMAEQPPHGVDVARLLDAAHAAAWHWQVAGDERHRMRARMLLAQAHALAGHGATALAYAEEMRRYFVGSPVTSGWELALTHAVHALAARAAGDGAAHARSHADAVATAAAVGDPEERALVERVFRHVPPP